MDFNKVHKVYGHLWSSNCDDVIVYNDTWIEHLATIRKFCDRLTDVFVNLSNSEFCRASVTFLGYFVGHGQI